MEIKTRQQKNIFLFAGQGAQYFNMAKELYEKDSIFQENMNRLDDKFYKLTKRNMLEVLYGLDNFAKDKFDDTRYTHPCIYMTEYSIAKMLIERGVYPDIVIGTSLGEVAAANIANIISEDDAVKIVVSQSSNIAKYCQRGSMLAVLSSYHIFEKWDFFSRTEIAAINYGEHFVVSGSESEIEKVKIQLNKKNISSIKIPVIHGFHSSMIEAAESYYMEDTRNVIINNAKIPMISCLTGEIVNIVSAQFFWRAIREPIQFEKTFRNIKQKGSFNFIDVSVGGTLASFVKRLISYVDKDKVFFTETPFCKAVNILPEILEMGS